MSLSDGVFSDFGRALWTLEVLASGLDEMLVPRQASSGENAGKPPARRGSRPPINLVVLDVKLDVLAVIRFWCGLVVRECPEVGPLPESREVGALAGWLRERLAVVERFEWAELAADEVIAQARWVEDVVSPPRGQQDPGPIEWGTSREVASWARNAGVRVSRETVRRWAEAGRVASRSDGARRLISLADVLTVGRGARQLAGGPPSC